MGNARFLLLFISILANGVLSLSSQNGGQEHIRQPVVWDSPLQHKSGNNGSFTVSERNQKGNSTSINHSEHANGIHLASWRWKEYGKILVLSLGLVLAGMVKLGFHHTRILSLYMPESCALILVGVFLGMFHHIPGINDYLPKFSSQLFFLILLPPIILDAAFSIYNRHFLENLGGVLVFAFIGTMFNAFCIGLGLYLINSLGWMGKLPGNLDTINSLRFAAMISAVDPVAVLAIFEDIGVNINLYFMVFGESLLNDGVSIVLYNSMENLEKISRSSNDGSIEEINYILACLSFVTVVFGGFLIGMCIGLVSSAIVRFTEHTQVIEPFLLIVMSYIAYILAEMFHWSGIISLLGCGIVQKRYAFRNISPISSSTIKHAIKTVATFSDCVIFLTLGAITISRPHYLQWHWGFVIWTCVLCLIVRFMGVFLLSFVLNMFSIKKISINEQIIMSYGGLRGAVGFSLAIIWYQETETPMVRIFLTTTLFMVYFTVFLQGGTIKLLVNKLNIKKEEETAKSISSDVHFRTIDLLMSGVGGILGGLHYNRFMKFIKLFEEKHVHKYFLRENVLNLMTVQLNEISMEEHYARLYGPAVLAREKKLGCILKPNDRYSFRKKSTSTKRLDDRKVLQDKESDLDNDTRPLNENRLAFRNVVSDRIMLRKAFLNSPYENSKSLVYSDLSILGSLNTALGIDIAYENILNDQKKKTEAIHNAAFSQDQMTPFKGKNNNLKHDELSQKIENDVDKTNHIKQVYHQIKINCKNPTGTI